MGIYWRTEMDDICELDAYIFAYSQLNHRFDVRLPLQRSIGSVRRRGRVGLGCANLAQHSHRRRRHAGLQLPDYHGGREALVI